MRKTLTYAATLLGGLFILSCNTQNTDPVDIEAPSIDLHEPVDYEMVESGGEIHYEANFADNTELSQFEVDIHGNFDSHAHGRIKSTSLPQFSFKESFDLSGKNIEIHQHIEVEQNGTVLFVAGPYDFVVNALDEVGNGTSFQDGSTKEVTILITNDQMPYLDDFDQNIEDGKITVEAGTTLTLAGLLADVADKGDEPGLAEIEIELHHEAEVEGNHSHRVLNEGHEMEWEHELNGALQYSLNDWPGFEIPANAEEGDYILQITAVDLDGNIMIRRFIVHII